MFLKIFEKYPIVLLMNNSSHQKSRIQRWLALQD